MSNQLTTLFVGGVFALLFALLAGFFTKVLAEYSRIWVMLTLVCVAISLIANRIVVTSLIGKAISSGKMVERAVIVGANLQTGKVVSGLKTENVPGIELIGIFEDRINRDLPNFGDLPILGSIDELISFTRTHDVDRLIVTLPWVTSDRVEILLRKLRTIPVRIELVPDDLIWRFPSTELKRIGTVPVLTIANGRIDQQRGAAKRIEDLLLSCAILLFASPVMLLVALFIKLDSR